MGNCLKTCRKDKTDHLGEMAEEGAHKLAITDAARTEAIGLMDDDGEITRAIADSDPLPDAGRLSAPPRAVPAASPNRRASAPVQKPVPVAPAPPVHHRLSEPPPATPAATPADRRRSDPSEYHIGTDHYARVKDDGVDWIEPSAPAQEPDARRRGSEHVPEKYHRTENRGGVVNCEELVQPAAVDPIQALADYDDAVTPPREMFVAARNITRLNGNITALSTDGLMKEYGRSKSECISWLERRRIHVPDAGRRLVSISNRHSYTSMLGITSVGLLCAAYFLRRRFLQAKRKRRDSFGFPSDVERSSLNACEQMV